jgi:glycosyltransferase involved in cell wall biosynthesis
VRVVVVTVEPPDPFGNAASRWFYVLFRGLVERGHDVTMLSTYGQAATFEQARKHFPAAHYDLRCFPVSGERGLLGKVASALRPYSYLFSEHFEHELRTVLARPFDVLHLEQLWTGWVGWRRAERALLNIHYLFSEDLVGVPPRGLYDRARRTASFRAERAILRHYPHLATLTERLVGDVQRLSGRKPSLIPLGIDASLYDFKPDDPPGPPTLGLIGNFAWQPTHRAALRLLTKQWPRVRERVPEARLLLAGREAAKMMSAHADDSVEIHENVPEIAPYFHRLHTLLYAPEHGSGTKVKVQESMAFGVPVVTNREGAEGIPARDGHELGLADDDAGLVDRTVALLTDPELRRERRQRARALLEETFGPKRTLDAVEQAHRAILRRA